ncbi:hypothetical protein RSW31_26720, partial [Escherichia coli]|uniref:hypothetical protein n=1 Tax=Escherichia coli TaxID=562 RepID=UPI0028DF5FB5
PFKDFFENLGDKGRGIAHSVIKERDELLAKFHNSKGEQVKTPNSAPLSNIETTLLAKETQTDEVVEEHTQSNDYLS